MIIEIAELEIKAGKEDSFMASFGTFREVFLSLPGGVLTRLLRDQAAPSVFSLVLQWETKDAQKLFESDVRYKAWAVQLREALGGAPRARYFDEVI